MVKELIKRVVAKLKNNSSKISWDSDISRNSTLGKENIVRCSKIISSLTGSRNHLIESAIYSSKLADDVSVSSRSLLFGSVISSNVMLGANVSLSNVEIGRYTYLAGNNRVFQAKIGAFCSIGENVIIGHAEHKISSISSSPLFYKADNPFGKKDFVGNFHNEFSQTNIGNDVWIGVNSFIKSGVHIHDGAVIGAGAIVTRDVEPYAIVVGSPAREIRKRFDDEVIDLLLKVKWWELNEHEIRELRFFLSSEVNISEIIKILKAG